MRKMPFGKEKPPTIKLALKILGTISPLAFPESLQAPG